MTRLFLRCFSGRLFPGGLHSIVFMCVALTAIGGMNAATITVTNTADSGTGSLRATLAAADDGDTIQFDATLNGQTITLTSSELLIGKNITITGPGPSLLAVSRDQQASNFRIFEIMSSHTVIIQGLTISGGFSDGVNNGGGILNGGSLTIANVTINGNQAGAASLAQTGYGGGIFNSGTLEVSNSFIHNNSANFSGAGLSNTGMLTITNSAISTNQAGLFMQSMPTLNGSGGGISNNGTLEISKSAITGNEGRLCGGGISNQGNGTVTITDSTIRDNVSGFKFSPGSGLGGGISNQDHGMVTIRNSQVSANRTTGHLAGFGGGGIGNSSATATVEISNSTVANNFSFVEGGGVLNNGGLLTIANSTFSGNFASTGHGADINNNGGMVQIGNTILDAGANGDSIFNSNSGTVTSHGYNLSSDSAGGFLTAIGDQINTDPRLGSLQDNGGLTYTNALLDGSPAINAGDPNFTPPPLYDQRGPGYDRVVNGRIDIGAYEVQSSLIVTTTADNGVGSLRGTLAAASNGDTIQFDAALNGQTITLTSGELLIDKNITIAGPGANMLTVSRDQQAPAFRIFEVMPDRTFILEGLTISGGLVDGADNGGGILNSGSLTIANVTISGNQAGLMSESQIGYGGGIANSGTLEISNSTIRNNSANFSGGGIYNSGMATITGGYLYGNEGGLLPVLAAWVWWRYLQQRKSGDQPRARSTTTNACSVVAAFTTLVLRR